MQPLPSMEQPRFTTLSAFAFRLVQAYTSWQDPRSGEDVFAYFQHSPQHRGDEHSRRATLIHEHILPAFNYAPTQIEYESQEREDLVLWNQHQYDRRKIAIIETKSSSHRNLAVLQRRAETPVEQLERYLSQAGLYLGVLTNGDEWHLLDFAVGREPLASLSLIELATLLQGASNQEMVEQRLTEQPLLRQALSVTLYYLDARRWEQTDVFRQQLTNPSYYHVASLQTSQQIDTLVQQIKQVLGSLRETIQAQFALLYHRYDEYQLHRTLASSTDQNSFTELLSSSIARVGEFETAFHLHEGSQLRAEIIALLSALAEQFLIDGDISAFESEYLQQAKILLTKYQLEQASLLDVNTIRSVRLLPPTSGLDELKALLQTHYAYLQALDEEYDLSKKTVEAYLTWQSSVRGVFRNPQDEFCLQTAYIHFVRIFFVRVCEDHGLIPRRISDGPFARFEAYRQELLAGIKDTYLRLLEETYQRARSVYHNFFGHKELYDWFTLDEYTILAIFDLLNRYDFRGISADVLGQVYNEGYIEAKDRSERGQFYTPPQVVDYMLDAIGIPGSNESDERKARAFLYKSVGDLSCGSGSFLVTAAARKSALLQCLVSADEIQPESALQLITETFLGFDLNPFACYLAEINLLIQCLPLLLDKEGKLSRSVDRFHIYCTDTLEPTVAEQVRALLNGTATNRLTLPSSHSSKRIISDDERAILSIKDARGLPSTLTQLEDLDSHGIDYLLGNPPYVSAGESTENLDYRNKIGNFGTYHFLHQRWDLFVPFFERNLQFLRSGTGRLALIVSKGIETEGYAEKLRQYLNTHCRILQIDFFPRLRLFQDAAIENTIVFVENRLPDATDQVIRHRHLQPDCRHFETLPPVQQLTAQEHLFRWHYNPALEQHLAVGSIPLCAIVYIGTGVEAQSKEAFDPIVNGRRQKLFTLDEVFLLPLADTSRPADYPDEGVLGNDVDRYFLRRKRYVAYDKYRPRMRRPRHIALFRTAEKLLLGETSGGYYDRAGLFANHSVQVVVPWHALEQAGAIEEKGIKTVLRESRQIAGIEDNLAPVAALFDLRYLLGIINSHFIREYLASNRLEGTREGRIYPDVWKHLPIKVASTERQQQVAILVDQIQDNYQQLAALPTPANLATSQMHIRTTIETLLSQVEMLVETIYYEPADPDRMEIIGKQRENNHNNALF
jgi:type I restriction-modification system DNA methylase subunit